MQNIEPVQLRQVRDLGQIVTSTFQFLKQNWKPLFRAIGTIVIPIALIAGFFMGKTVGDLQGMIFSGSLSGEPSAMLGALAGNMLPMIGGYILVFAAVMLLIAIVHEYIRLYDMGQHHGVTTAQLWSLSTGQLGSYIGMSILSGLLVMLGALLCIFPLFYPLTVLSLILIVHAIERKGATGSMSRSNELVQGRFWDTLGLVIVIGLVNAVVSYAIMLPITIVGAVLGFNGIMAMAEGEPGAMDGYGMFMSIQMAIQMAVTVLTYPIVYVGLSLKYFSLVEEKEGSGLRQKVEGFEDI
ncbi:MAG: hypothetical protein IPI00_15825 [Flavobacteriales bacterium]|nr:hypothetical protein [Flavobacteriales bacterium]MBK6945477.1 hypothetical protein [Flavobacteriales bacterium]MBK7241590.1 hypothetical protein [Flavobacteriales bacterium]MBK7296424.1 hypothetical protein [Flavobacteriales bacterium]MBK9534969.1 hypothetical protein [Flavobacteriales bacterium]